MGLFSSFFGDKPSHSDDEANDRDWALRMLRKKIAASEPVRLTPEQFAHFFYEEKVRRVAYEAHVPLRVAHENGVWEWRWCEVQFFDKEEGVVALMPEDGRRRLPLFRRLGGSAGRTWLVDPKSVPS